MKTIIAGCRDIDAPISAVCVLEAVEASGFAVSEIVCGCASGIDLAGLAYARANNLPIAWFPAWYGNVKTMQKHAMPGEYVHRCFHEAGTAAGPLRNKAMAEYADALVAVWDGKSRGTKSMIDEAKRAGIKVHVLRVDGEATP